MSLQVSVDKTGNDRIDAERGEKNTMREGMKGELTGKDKWKSGEEVNETEKRGSRRVE